MGDEKGDLSIRNSRKLYIPIYSMSVILLLIVAFLKFQEFTLNKMVVWTVVLFILFGVCTTEIHRLKNKYEINPNSIAHIEGYLNKTSKRVDLFAISDVDIAQSWWQRIWGFGNVNVHLFSAESTTAIKNINNPKNFATVLEQKMTERRTKGGLKKDAS